MEESEELGMKSKLKIKRREESKRTGKRERWRTRMAGYCRRNAPSPSLSCGEQYCVTRWANSGCGMRREMNWFTSSMLKGTRAGLGKVAVRACVNEGEVAAGAAIPNENNIKIKEEE